MKFFLLPDQTNAVAGVFGMLEERGVRDHGRDLLIACDTCSDGDMGALVFDTGDKGLDPAVFGRGHADGVGPDGEMPLRQGNDVMTAHETRHEFGFWGIEDRLRAARLFDHRVVHHHDFVRQGQRLVLTVGDVAES